MQTRRSQPDFKAVPLRNTIRVPPSTTGYCSPRPPPFHRLAQSVPLVMTAATGGGTRADDRMQLKEERDTGCGSCQAPVALATLRGRFGRLLRERRPCLHWVPRPTSPTEGARRSPISSPPPPCTLLNDFARLVLWSRAGRREPPSAPCVLSTWGGNVPRRSATDGCPVGSLRRGAPVQGPADIVGGPVDRQKGRFD